jgi:hypothetical protein
MERADVPAQEVEFPLLYSISWTGLQGFLSLFEMKSPGVQEIRTSSYAENMLRSARSDHYRNNHSRKMPVKMKLFRWASVPCRKPRGRALFF